jgi:hypothetical protein
MMQWTVEPLWQTFERLLATAPIQAGDVLTPVAAEQARPQRQAKRSYKGLDAMKSRLGQGEVGILVRRFPGP